MYCLLIINLWIRIILSFYTFNVLTSFLYLITFLANTTHIIMTATSRTLNNVLNSIFIFVTLILLFYIIISNWLFLFFFLYIFNIWFNNTSTFFSGCFNFLCNFWHIINLFFLNNFNCIYITINFISSLYGICLNGRIIWFCSFINNNILLASL